jgi:tetratricopeptide (TPR) repeat protein/transcriptional regulator with XRE-family HTH domain
MSETQPPSKETQHPLKLERKLRGWSQSRIAEALGITTRTVSRWEQGLSVPYPYYREQLCALFGKNARELGMISDNDESEQGTIYQVGEEAADAVSSVGAPKLLSTIYQESPAAGRTMTIDTVTDPLTPIVSDQDTSLIDPAIPEVLGSANRLLGRHTLMMHVKERLLQGDSLALTALNGLPGIGKTALAVALATDLEVQTRFRDGILWAGLGPHPKVLDLLARWGKLLGVAPSEVENVNSQEAWGRTLRATIGKRRLLLIIDDAWSPEDALAFQVGGAHCVHLLTTRLPQVAFTFAQQGAIVVPELEEADGLALLARFIPQHVQQHPEDACALVRAVGGLPLALTLMGKYLASHAFTGQPRRVQAALSQLQNTERRLCLSMPVAPSERSPSLSDTTPLSLHATIAISDQQLDPQAHAALCSLSVFPPKPNSFSEEAALAITQEPVEVLDTLWDAGLLESSGPSRYTLHRTIADYAQTQTQDLAAMHSSSIQSSSNALQNALLGWEMHCKERLVNYMLPYIQTHQRDYEALEQEANNILAALDAAIILEMQHELIEGTIMLVPFMRVRGRYAQAEHYLQQALKATISLNDEERQTTVLRYLATFAELHGDNPLAERYSQQGLVIARRLNQIDAVSALLTTLGLAAFHRGDHAQAQTCYEEALSIARQLGTRERVCTLLSYLGEVALFQGNFTQAEALCQEGLALARQIEHQELTSLLLASLGAVAGRQSNYAQAEPYLQEGLALARQLGHRELQSRLLSNLGVITHHLGNYEQAEAYLQEALALARQIGHRVQFCRLLTNLGGFAIRQGDYTQAESYLQEGIELARQFGHFDLPLMLMNLGKAVGEQGDYYRANACFEESIELTRRQGASWYMGAALIYWGELHLKYQQLEAANIAFRKVISLNSGPEQRDLQLIAWAYYGLAQSAALYDDIAGARSLGTDSLIALETIGDSKAEEVRFWLNSLSKKEDASV